MCGHFSSLLLRLWHNFRAITPPFCELFRLLWEPVSQASKAEKLSPTKYGTTIHGNDKLWLIDVMVKGGSIDWFKECSWHLFSAIALRSCPQPLLSSCLDTADLFSLFFYHFSPLCLLCHEQNLLFRSVSRTPSAMQGVSNFELQSGPRMEKLVQDFWSNRFGLGHRNVAFPGRKSWMIASAIFLSFFFYPFRPLSSIFHQQNCLFRFGPVSKTPMGLSIISE